MTPIGSPVSAQIGLVLRLRNSLSQMSTRIVVLIGAGTPARSKAVAIALHPARHRAVGLAQGEFVESSGRVADDPGFDDLVGRVDHAADDPFEPDRARQHPTGIEAR